VIDKVVQENGGMSILVGVMEAVVVDVEVVDVGRLIVGEVDELVVVLVDLTTAGEESAVVDLTGVNN